MYIWINPRTYRFWASQMQCLPLTLWVWKALLEQDPFGNDHAPKPTCAPCPVCYLWNSAFVFWNPLIGSPELTPQRQAQWTLVHPLPIGFLRAPTSATPLSLKAGNLRFCSCGVSESSSYLLPLVLCPVHLLWADPGSRVLFVLYPVLLYIFSHTDASSCRASATCLCSGLHLQSRTLLWVSQVRYPATLRTGPFGCQGTGDCRLICRASFTPEAFFLTARKLETRRLFHLLVSFLPMDHLSHLLGDFPSCISLKSSPPCPCFHSFFFTFFSLQYLESWLPSADLFLSSPSSI